MSNQGDTLSAEAPAPPADLKDLGDRLVGAWKISGEAEGETAWEWMEGGFFLIQRGWSRRERNGAEVPADHRLRPRARLRAGRCDHWPAVHGPRRHAHLHV